MGRPIGTVIRRIVQLFQGANVYKAGISQPFVTTVCALVMTINGRMAVNLGVSFSTVAEIRLVRRPLFILEH